jgi:hypothetical protein
VFGVDGAIVEESLVLFHASVKGHIVVLAPATEGVEEKDGVLVALLEELLTGILEEENVTVMEGVANLEGVHGVSTTGLDLVGDLAGSEAVLVHAVVELDALGEVHASTRDKPFTLFHNGLSTGVVGAEGAEGTGADLFLAVLVELRLVDNGVDDTLVLDSELLGVTNESLLFLVHVHGDGNGEEVALSLLVGNCPHLHGLEELQLVHESVEGEGPAVTDGMEVLALVLVNLNSGEFLVFGLLLAGGVADEALDNALLFSAGENLLVVHVLNDESGGLGNSHLTGVDVEVGVSGGLVGVRDTSELGNDTSAGLGVKSLDVTAFANLEGGGDMALEESKTSLGVELLGEVTVLRVG